MNHEEIKGLLEEISPWPWRIEYEPGYEKNLGLADIIQLDGLSLLNYKYEDTDLKPRDKKFIAFSPSIISQLLKEVEVMREALEYYAKMESFCLHDDPMLCDNCPDGGVFARKVLRDCEKIKEEV